MTIIPRLAFGQSTRHRLAILRLLFVLLAGTAAWPADPGRLEAHVRVLARDCVPRDWKHPENLARAAAYLRGRFEACGATVSEQPYEVAGRTYRNVIARYGPGTGPRLVVGAHYDAWGDFPGADDNASGVAGLLELARLLQEKRPALTVELVAFVLEEPPHFRTPDMGSARHAARLKEQGVKVRAMLSLDMIGKFVDAAQAGDSPARVPDLGPARRSITVVGDKASLVRKVKRGMSRVPGLEVRSQVAPRSTRGVDWSDHLSYWNLGFPAVMINDLVHRQDDTYHTGRDVPEALDYAGLALVVDAVHGALMELGRP